MYCLGVQCPKAEAVFFGVVYVYERERECLCVLEPIRQMCLFCVLCSRFDVDVCVCVCVSDMLFLLLVDICVFCVYLHHYACLYTCVWMHVYVVEEDRKRGEKQKRERERERVFHPPRRFVMRLYHRGPWRLIMSHRDKMAVWLLYISTTTHTHTTINTFIKTLLCVLECYNLASVRSHTLIQSYSESKSAEHAHSYTHIHLQAKSYMHTHTHTHTHTHKISHTDSGHPLVPP